MKNYITNEGLRYSADCAAGLVRQLKADSKSGGHIKKSDWRNDSAYRASQATGTIVRGDSDAHFVEDLINAGLLKEEG
jgi:hypothetical protein